MNIGTTGQVRDLGGFTGVGYDKGRPMLMQATWWVCSNTVFQKWWAPNWMRVRLLRIFGATIGTCVVIRSRVRVHWPWKLTIGDNVWIGEGAWLLNLEPIVIGDNVCVSQEALLCTGSHDAKSPTFEYKNAPIELRSGSWICTRACVLAGAVVGEGVTVGAAQVFRAVEAAGATQASPPRR
jgi:putative colanic acid biosynthesis acetyltransferase WcaF